MAAVALVATGCMDTDAQYSIPEVAAPQILTADYLYVNSNAVVNDGTISDYGDVTIEVVYDKNIGFPSSRYNEISATNMTILAAEVIGTDNVLTINANIPRRGVECSFTIPEGLVKGPNGTSAPAVTFTFNVKGASALASTPVSATSANALALYQYLLKNYGTSVLSGMMANVAWNNEQSEAVYAVTGKYPAINGYDYIHLPASCAGANWINYADITPVSEWDAAGGIVAAGWHWLVPKTEVTVSSGSEESGSSEETTIWEGDLNIGNDWAVSGTVEASAFSGVSEGTALTIYFAENSDAEYWQAKLMDGNWTTLTSYADVDNGWGCIPLDAGATSYTITLNASDVSLLQASGMVLSGYGITYKKITVGGASSGTTSTEGTYAALDVNNDFTYSPSETEFNLTDAVTEGTWEYNYVYFDLERIANYLLLLKEQNIPVLWRPLHEASGGWFWWGTDATAFKKLWIMMFQYFESKGLNNLIWVWTAQGNDSDWYPGDDYVDIIGCDLYGCSASECAAMFKSLSDTYPNKMITLSECGYDSYSASRVANISDQWSAGAQWSWFMPWYSDDTTVHADDSWWSDAMNQDYVITRDKVSYK